MARPRSNPAPASPAVQGFFNTRRLGFKAQARGSRNPFFPADEEFVCEIKHVTIAFRSEAYVIECTVLEGPDDLIGRTCACIIKKNEYQPQKVAEFVCAAYGCNPSADDDISQFGDPAFNASLESDWTQLGKKIRLTTREVIVKSTGKPFTVHYWQPHEDTTAATSANPADLMAVIETAAE